MTSTADATTFELNEVCLQLASQLRISVQQGRQGVWYLIEDPSRNAFYRIGVAEYTFLSMLDGKTTLATAVATTSSLGKSDVLSEQEAIQLARWLVESGLARTEASSSGARAVEQAATNTASVPSWLNPISIRFRLFNLDRLMDRSIGYFGWIYHWAVVPFALLLVTYAVLCLSMGWTRLQTSTEQIFAPSSFVWLSLTWVVTKLIHEFAHALTCKRLGGKVGDFGVLFLLFVPLPFVDVTSAWRFPAKRDRIFVSAAGMMAELLLASIAAIIWYHAGPGIVSQYATNVMVAASLHTILFNANPLMRFDGYHILADAAEVPNLAGHGSQYVKSLFRRSLLGLPASRLAYVGWLGLFVRAYGVAATVWKILVCVTLCAAAANFLNGIGVLIAVLACIGWIGRPALQFTRFLIHGSPYETPNRRHFALVTAGALLAFCAFGMLLPAPNIVRAPAVIDFEPLFVLRTQTPGFVASVHVSDRQWVSSGQPLVTLENETLVSQISITKAMIQQSRLRAATFQADGMVAAWQSEQESVSSLKAKLDELLISTQRLTLTSPSDGIVIAKDLELLPGQYIEQGRAVLSVGIPERKTAIALIDQHHFKNPERVLGNDVRLLIWGRASGIDGVVKKVSPRLRDDLPHVALAASFGGPLAVSKRQHAFGGSSDETSADNFQLTEPRVRIDISLPNQASSNLLAGETAIVQLRGETARIGPYVVERTTRWLRSKFMMNHGL